MAERSPQLGDCESANDGGHNDPPGKEHVDVAAVSLHFAGCGKIHEGQERGDAGISNRSECIDVIGKRPSQDGPANSLLAKDLGHEGLGGNALFGKAPRLEGRFRSKTALKGGESGVDNVRLDSITGIVGAGKGTVCSDCGKESVEHDSARGDANL